MEPGASPEQSSPTPPSGGAEKSSLGLDANLAGLLCYLLLFVSGIIFWALEKESSTVRFHAVQSTFTFIALIVIQIISGSLPVIGWMLAPLISLGTLIVWVILMVKAIQGERFKLPVVGDLAEERSALS